MGRLIEILAIIGNTQAAQTTALTALSQTSKERNFQNRINTRESPKKVTCKNRVLFIQEMIDFEKQLEENAIKILCGHLQDV